MHPMRLARRLEPFDHPDWIYEIKFDGFGALAYIDEGKCRLVSRRRHEYKSFRELQASIAELPVANAVLDGEIVCLDSIRSVAVL
jgi:bifunctional non-homologous end joining protein LigD